MLKLIDEVKRKIPKSIEGFVCIKKQDVFIPYMEIGIDCLTRNISDINLFFETILKLIDIGVKNIFEIAKILGISNAIAKEAIVDMVSIDYITVSENALKITPKGRDALKNRKIIQMKRTNLNNVVVNLITGQIVDGDNITAEKANKYSVCLEENIKINENFLDLNFQNINLVFQTQQESNSAFGKSGVTKELYKLLGIQYQKLIYVKKHVKIYKSETSDEFQFLFDDDPNNIYLNALYEQLQKPVHPNLDNFFEKDYQYGKRMSYLSLDESIYKTTKDLWEVLLNKKIDQDRLYTLFSKKRYAIYPDEYIDYFKMSNRLSFESLLICSNRMNNIISPSLSSEIIRISENVPVFIIYDKNEYNAERSLKHFFGKFEKNIFLVSRDNITDSAICFESQLIIDICEYKINAFEQVLSYKMPIINFDKESANNWLMETIEQYNIAQLISNAKK